MDILADDVGRRGPSVRWPFQRRLDSWHLEIINARIRWDRSPRLPPAALGSFRCTHMRQVAGNCNRFDSSTYLRSVMDRFLIQTIIPGSKEGWVKWNWIEPSRGVFDCRCRTYTEQLAESGWSWNGPRSGYNAGQYEKQKHVTLFSVSSNIAQTKRSSPCSLLDKMSVKDKHKHHSNYSHMAFRS